MWIVYALLQSFFFGITNLIDTYTVRTYGETKWGVWGPMMFMGVFCTLVVFILFPFVDIVSDPRDRIKLIGAGGLFFLGMIPYTLALKDHETSRVMTIILVAIPVFSYFFGLFLGEIIHISRVIVGIVTLVLGGMFAYIGREKDSSSGGKSAHLVLYSVGAAFFWSLVSFLFSWGEEGNNFWDAIFLEFVGMTCMCGLLLFIPRFRSSLFGLFSGPKKLISIMSINEFLGILGDICIAAALTQGVLFSVTLVSNVSQPVLVFLMALGVSYFFPHILSEDISRSVLYKKMILLICILCSLVVFVSL